MGRVNALDQGNIGIRQKLAQVKTLGALGDRPGAQPTLLPTLPQANPKRVIVVFDLVEHKALLLEQRSEVADQTFDTLEGSIGCLPGRIVLPSGRMQACARHLDSSQL